MNKEINKKIRKRTLEFIVKNPIEFDFYNTNSKIKTIKIGIKQCIIGYKIYESQQRYELNKYGTINAPKIRKIRFYNEEKLLNFYVKLYKRIDKLSKENIFKMLKLK